jgi:hypothetical protein
MGRGTADNVVDIDLGKEGRANKVSRRQVHYPPNLTGDEVVVI